MTVDVASFAKVLGISEEQAVATAQRELCRISFVDFLKFCKIRSDDPLNPGVRQWQMWAYLLNRAASWESGESEVILKARQLGYSWLVNLFMYWKAAYQGMQVGYLSVGQREAREQMRRMLFTHETLPEHLQVRGQINVDDARFEGGGAVFAFPSTESAGISYTFGLVIMDELAFHPYGAANYAAMRPTISAGGQFIALSTADPALGPSGFFHDIYWSSKAGETPYKAHFEPWHSRPSRDEDWLARERAAYTGMPDEFDAFFPDTDSAAFVSRTGLVFPMFSKERHVKPPRVPLAQCRRVVAGVDLGGGDPTAIVILGLDDRHHVHQYAEFYKRGAQSIDTLISFLKDYKVDAVMCPPEQATVWETLRSLRFPAMPAKNQRKDGLELCATLFTNDRMTIDPSCRDSIAEFPGYRWSEKTDPNDRTKYATKTPVDHHADAMDARRYAVMEITQMLRAPRVMPRFTLSGKRMARVAV